MSPSGYDAPKVAEALKETPTLVVFAGQDSEEVREGKREGGKEGRGGRMKKVGL
jgi:hypothetical protein